MINSHLSAIFYRKVIKMIAILFDDIKSVATSFFRSTFIALSIFLTTMIYGEDVKLNLSYEMPNEVYEYEAGDTVEFTIKCENTGKAFETWFPCDDEGHWMEASVYQKDENGDFHRLYYTHAFLEGQITSTHGFDGIFLNHGHIYEKTYSFVIPEDAPKGEYAITLRCYVYSFGHSENTGEHTEVFEGFITVK